MPFKQNLAYELLKEQFPYNCVIICSINMTVEILGTIQVSDGDFAARMLHRGRKKDLLIKTNKIINPRFIQCLDYTAPDHNLLSNNPVVNYLRERGLKREVNKAILSGKPVEMTFARLVPNDSS